MKLKVGEKELDLNKCLPLTIGDWAAFEAAGLIEADGSVSTGSAGGVLGFLGVLFKKIDPKIKEAELKSIPLHEIGPISEFLGEALASAGNDPTQDGSQN